MSEIRDELSKAAAADASKVSKKSVDYSRGHFNSRCGVCVHYLPASHQCEKVKGTISPAYWCKLFRHK